MSTNISTKGIRTQAIHGGEEKALRAGMCMVWIETRIHAIRATMPVWLSSCLNEFAQQPQAHSHCAGVLHSE